MSRWISMLVLDGRQLRASARSISLPGLCVMTMSYCCSQRSILWSLTGAAMRFFRLIISRGLWSVSTMNVLPYRYMWNLSQLYTMARSSLLMLAYQVSVSVRDLLAKWWGVHPGWCRLPAPWVRHHTGGWPVCSDHSIWGVSGGLSAGGTWFSGSTCWSSHPRQNCSPFSGGPGGSLCCCWDEEQMSAGNSLHQGRTVAPVSSGVVSFLRCLGSFPDLGSILLPRRLLQRMSLIPVLWHTFCCWRQVLLSGPHWISL